MMYGTSLHQVNNDEDRSRSDSRCVYIADYSEPCFWISIVYGTVAFIYAMVVGLDFWSATAGVLATIGLLGTWRIRKLGVAMSIMQSVDEFRQENARLVNEVDDLESANETYSQNNTRLRENNQSLHADIYKFEKITGVLGDTAQDLVENKKELFRLYDEYKVQNEKYEANNLMSLFNLVDKDSNGRLDKKELARLKEYIQIVYKTEIDFSILDRDCDGNVSLTEFIQRFRDKFNDNDNRKASRKENMVGVVIEI